MSEAIDTDQSAVLLVTKVIFDTDRWKVVTEMFIDTDNDHISSYQVVWHVLHLIAYYYSGHAVFIVLLMEE